MSKVGPVLSRKAFILPAMAITGAGVGFGLRLMPGTESGAIEMNNWITVSPNNTITVRVAQMEMGQGVMTSLPQLLADDLDPHAARDTGSMAGHRRDAGIPPARCVGRFCREAVPGATGLVRGVARATHNFTNQCFLDELARTTGKDPCPLDAERRGC